MKGLQYDAVTFGSCINIDFEFSVMIYSSFKKKNMDRKTHVAFSILDFCGAQNKFLKNMSLF